METPASGMTAKKKNRRIKRTPGSGEALLRGQVKTLLQKVEEEAELTKISTVTRLPFLHFLTSPMGLVAPTPANTPQLDIVIASPVVEEHLRSSQEVVGGICEGKDESLEALKSLSITRSLLLDFSDKSESSDSLSAEDESSVWSMQVNASTRDEDDDDDDEDQVSCYQGEEEEEEEGLLCEGIRKMSMVESDKKTKAEFAGKHTRFVYDSEGEEIVEEQTLGVLRLKGLPTPKGKHFRFAAEEEEEDTVSNS